jgi:hypothetical protein
MHTLASLYMVDTRLDTNQASTKSTEHRRVIKEWVEKRTSVNKTLSTMLKHEQEY